MAIRDAEEMTARFEAYEPDPADERDVEPLNLLKTAAKARADIELDVLVSVERARAAGYSWAVIGSMLGTSGEVARQRYETPIAHDEVDPSEPT